MGLLSFLRELVEGGGTAQDQLAHAELELVRELGERAERGEAAPDGHALGPKIRRRYRFVGSVQGVGFRFTTAQIAKSVGAVGWVRNERDGSVTAEIQGIEEQVDAVIGGLDNYYNGRRLVMGGFTIAEARDVPLVEGEHDLYPKY